MDRSPPLVEADIASRQASDRGGVRQRFSPRRWPSSVIALALLAVAAGGIFSDALLTGKYVTPDAVVFSAAPFEGHRPPTVSPTSDHALDDLTYLYHPYLLHARTSFRLGHLPAWDPHVGAGRPLGAQQAAPLFPLSWVSYVLPFEASFVLVLMLKILVAGFGTYLFCRRLKLGAGAAIFGAAAFALGNPFVPFLGAGATNSFLLLPWMLLLVNRLVQRAAVVDSLLLGLVAGGAVYGGHPESWAVAYLVVSAYAVFELFAVHPDAFDRRHRLRQAGLLGFAGLLAICVGALALLPLFELLGQSDHLSRAFEGVDSLKQLAAGAFAPEFWGRHDKHVFQKGSFSTLSSIYAGRPYVGALPLLFAGATLSIRSGRERLFFVALAAVSLLGLVLSPLRDVARQIPGLSLVNLQELIWPLTFAGCVLAGFGLQWVLDAPARARRRFFLTLGALGGIAAIVLVLSRPGMLGSLGSAIDQFPSLRRETQSADAAALGSVLRLGALTFAGLVFGAYALLRRGSSRAFVVIILAITVIDLVTLARGFFPAVSKQAARPTAPPSIGLARAGGSQARLTGIGYGTFAPNLSDRFGGYDTRVEDLPEIKRYSSAFTALGGSEQLGLGRTYVPALTSQTGRLLDVFGSRYVLDDGKTPIARAPQLRVMYTHPGERLLQNPDAFPRAWVAYGWHGALNVSQALGQLRTAPTASLLRSPVIEGVKSSRVAAHPISVAAITRSADAAVEMTVTAEQPGYLVLDDTLYPGWTARVDGTKTPIQPANVAFRGVPVAPGTHRVTFKYESTSVRLGLILSLLGVVGALAGTLAAGWRQRGRRRAHSMRAGLNADARTI